MNQARSILSEAILKKFMTNVNVNSAGIEAVSGADTLRFVILNGQKWGLPLKNKPSKNIKELELNCFNYILVAEESMKLYFQNSGAEVFSYEDFCTLEELIPKDPASLSPESAEIELAKVFAATYKFADSIIKRKASNISLVMPMEERNITQAIKQAIKLSQSQNSILIDADLRNSFRNDFINEGINWLKIDDSFSAINFHLNTAYYLESASLDPIFELAEGEYLAKIRKISQSRDITLIAPPIYANSKRLPDSILLSAIADQIHPIFD